MRWREPDMRCTLPFTLRKLRSSDPFADLIWSPVVEDSELWVSEIPIVESACEKVHVMPKLLCVRVETHPDHCVPMAHQRYPWVHRRGLRQSPPGSGRLFAELWSAWDPARRILWCSAGNDAAVSAVAFWDADLFTDENPASVRGSRHL